jgi:hypothetical protein
MKNPNIKRGKKSRAAGKRFELKVRADLEKQGWIVDKWSNNVEFSDKLKDAIELPFGGEVPVGKLVPCKPKFNPFTKSLMMNSGGFPDFVCIKNSLECIQHCISGRSSKIFDVQFVECKTNGYLDKTEKDKVEWIKQNLKIPVIIASKGDKRGEINYEM